MLRLQKFLAKAGLGSRRSCEQFIKDNRVSVNGKVAALGTKVSENDEVTFDGNRVFPKAADLKVIMLNKPRGVLSSKKDDKKIKLVFDFLPKVFNEPDWIAVGRLDINTSGLMLFTNDGKLAHQLMHPSFEIDREYLVRARGNFNEQKKKNMLTGVKIEDEIYQFSDIVPGEKQSSNQWFSVCMLTKIMAAVVLASRACSIQLMRAEAILVPAKPAKKALLAAMRHSHTLAAAAA